MDIALDFVCAPTQRKKQYFGQIASNYDWELRKKKYFGQDVLKLYLNMIFQFIQIYQVIEYELLTCFKQFVNAVFDARREGGGDDS